MPLARLENFLKNLNGNTLYVDPNELDATDSIENRGNSRLRPFKTIQRALLEAARFSYIAGSNNDLFDQTTILISPGTHYIDNRPGYYVNGNTLYDVNNSTKTIPEFNILSNFDLTDPANELYVYNSVNGGVVLPKGTSLVATDLRKTKIRPLFVPDPEQSQISNTSIFRLTGSCYFFGFTIYDGDPLGKVYNTYATNTVVPNYSHHKLTAFEYADGVNKVVKNGLNTGHTDLEMYYYKLSLGFGQQSGRSIIDGYLNFQPNVDEYRIVGDLGVGSINISSVISGDGVNGTNVITVTTETEHNLSQLTPILISGVGNDQGAPTTTEYNGNFIVAQVLNQTQFTYLLSNVPTGSLTPSVAGASIKVISDTTTSSSPYIFNCSLKSVYGMNGLHADGSKATGFRSMVTAQFTGISLQKDDRAFVIYDDGTGSYLDQTNFGTNKFLHQDINSIYKPDWESFHIKASNDAFIQCVSIFAIGYANQFTADNGGDQSITNSNSNFGQRSLFSEGFKKQAFPKDDHGFITHIIPPKDVSTDEQNINTYPVSDQIATTNTRIYLKGYNDILNPPNEKVRGYAIGGRQYDKIYYAYLGVEYYADIVPNYQVKTNVSSIDTTLNYLNLASISGISTGLAVKIVAKNSVLPDGIVHDKTYFVRPVVGNNVRLYENLENCNSDISNVGDAAVDIKNTVGLSANNLYLVSKVSDLSSGSVGSPIQWDPTNRNWYIAISINSGSPNFVNILSTYQITPTLYLKRVIDTRSNDDRSYRVRYVIPKDSENAAVPTSGFIFQKSSYSLNGTYSQSSSTELSSVTGDQLSTIRNKNVVIDAWYSSGTATIVTKNAHKLRVGNKVSIHNLQSSNEPNPIGIGTGTGFNGSFVVTSVPDDITFTYAISVDPGTITTGSSNITSWLNLRDCSQQSRVPPYTIYNTNRENLPYFTCDQIENSYQAYSVKEIQPYVQGSTDGVYHVTLDCYKNTPSVSPFNIDDYKLGQSLDNIVPKLDFDNLTVDPDPSTTIASRSTIGMVDISDPYLSSTKEIIVDYFKDFGLGNRITGFSVSGSSVTITTEQNHGIGGIRRVTSASLGSGYLDGTYYDIPLCGGTGKNATINVTISGGVPSAFEIANPGSGYAVGNTLTIKGIPGSTNSTTVTIPTSTGLYLDTTNSDLIQILGATNSANNGYFVINSVTANTITFTNTSGVNETTTNAVVVMSGPGYPINSAIYDAVSNITTITTGTFNPHSLALGNKILFNVNNLGICTVTNVSDIYTFSIKGDASTATRVYIVGLVPTLKDTTALNENLNVRDFVVYGGYKSRAAQSILVSATSFVVNNIQGLKKGDFILVESEIMLVTSVSGSGILVKRALFGTQAVAHPSNVAVETINVVPVELRRPSILRASGHTFEYTGFGPGNYSTAMPSNQTKVLNDSEISISQALPNRGGLVFYAGMNSLGQYFIGKKKFDSSTGKEVSAVGAQGNGVSSDFDTLVVNNLIVNQSIDASTAVETAKYLEVINGLKSSGIVTATTFSGPLANALTLNTSGIGLTGTATFNNSSSSIFTVNSNATSSNLEGTIVARDVNGNFNAGTITSNVTGNLTGNVTGNVTNTVIGTNSIEIVRGNMADSDAFRILVGGTGTDSGYVEFATGDNGSEPIYFRQYGGGGYGSGNPFSSVVRTATILDGSGNTSFPGSVTVGNQINVSSGSLSFTGTTNDGDGDIVSTGGADKIFGIFNSSTSGSITFNTKDSNGTSVGVLGLNYDGVAINKNLTVNAPSTINGYGTIPVGGIIMWSGSTQNIPAGWALCNGQTSNNQVTPDLRDRFIVGAGSSYSVGNTGGANSVTLTLDQIPPHSHTPNSGEAFAISNSDGIETGYFTYLPRSYTTVGLNTNFIAMGTINQTTSVVGGGQAHENRPPYYALAFIMRVA